MSKEIVETKKTKKELTFFQDYQGLMKDVVALTRDQLNPFFKSKYVPLKSVLSEAKRVCLENNFIFYQTTTLDITREEQAETILITTLEHSSGKSIKSEIPIVAKDKNDPQKIGGGLTYMRRYSLTCILGIEETDDDGNKSSVTKKTAKPTIQEIISSIRSIKDKKTLNEMKEKIANSKLYSQAQKNILLTAIEENLKI